MEVFDFLVKGEVGRGGTSGVGFHEGEETRHLGVMEPVEEAAVVHFQEGGHHHVVFDAPGNGFDLSTRESEALHDFCGQFRAHFGVRVETDAFFEGESVRFADIVEEGSETGNQGIAG